MTEDNHSPDKQKLEDGPRVDIIENASVTNTANIEMNQNPSSCNLQSSFKAPLGGGSGAAES